MPVIEVNHLQKRYRDHIAVHDVSFTVERGEIFGIIGPNGAGKTTTVECIEGLRTPDQGTVRVWGLDPQRDKVALRSRVGVQLQQSQFPEKIKVWEVLDLYSSFYRAPANWRALLEEVGLVEKRNTAYERLSGGQKQRLSIAVALIGNPDVAILDELTTGLDPQARREIWAMIEQIRGRGVTILLVSHFMEEVERLCDRVAVIASGRVAAIDTPTGLISRTHAEQRIAFRSTGLEDERILTDLPEVHTVKKHGSRVLVTGTGNLLSVVTSALAQHQIEANEFRAEQATLDDAFLVLTGCTSDKEEIAQVRERSSR
jgi:ABC-2 type transport system ATP-binding protein